MSSEYVTSGLRLSGWYTSARNVVISNVWPPFCNPTVPKRWPCSQTESAQSQARSPRRRRGGRRSRCRCRSRGAEPVEEHVAHDPADEVPAMSAAWNAHASAWVAESGSKKGASRGGTVTCVFCRAGPGPVGTECTVMDDGEMISLSQEFARFSRGPHDVAAGPAGRGRLGPKRLSGKRRHRGHDGISQGLEVVAALEEAHGRARRGQRPGGREVGEVARREPEARERIGRWASYPAETSTQVEGEALGQRGRPRSSSASR